MADLGFVEGLKVVAAVAAPAGLGIGLFIFFARAALAKKIYPQLTKADGVRLILHLAYQAWSIAIVAIAAWVIVSIWGSQPQPQPQPDPRPVPPGPIPSAPVPEPAASTPKPPYIPDQQSGWILVGSFREHVGWPSDDVALGIKRPTGPATAGTFAEYRKSIAVEVLTPVRVRVVNFVNLGWRNSTVKPTGQDRLEKSDETGVTLPAGSQMLIRDVAWYQDGDLRVMYVRVADRPPR